jgi:hypothetical protein
MQYITGIHALNLDCALETCGDWHMSALKWENITIRESNDMFFKDYGIEQGHTIPNHSGTYAVANHIRALLDLLELGNFAVAQGMNKDFICNPAYDNEIMEKIYSMRTLPNWKEIDSFTGKEYRMKWLKFKEGKNEKLAD